MTNKFDNKFLCLYSQSQSPLTDLSVLVMCHALLSCVWQDCVSTWRYVHRCHKRRVKCIDSMYLLISAMLHSCISVPFLICFHILRLRFTVSKSIDSIWPAVSSVLTFHASQKVGDTLSHTFVGIVKTSEWGIFGPSLLPNGQLKYF